MSTFIFVFIFCQHLIQKVGMGGQEKRQGEKGWEISKTSQGSQESINSLLCLEQVPLLIKPCCHTFSAWKLGQTLYRTCSSLRKCQHDQVYLEILHSILLSLRLTVCIKYAGATSSSKTVKNLTWIVSEQPQSHTHTCLWNPHQHNADLVLQEDTPSN